MNKIYDWAEYIFGLVKPVPEPWQDNDYGSDDDDNNGVSIRTQIAQLSYMEILEKNENFQIDAKKNVFFLIVEKKDWEKSSTYSVDGLVKLYSSVPLKELSRIAFRKEIELGSLKNETCFVHTRISEDCECLVTKNKASSQKLIYSKKYDVIAVVLHDDPISVLSEQIAFNSKQQFRKGVVYSEVTNGLRSVFLNRPIDKLRDVYVRVGVAMKETVDSTEVSARFVVDDDSLIIENLKQQAKINGIEEKSKLEKIKI